MKEWIQSVHLMDFIAAGILLTAVMMNGLKRLESCVKAYTINSWLLTSLISVIAFTKGETHLYAAAFITAISKGALIPLFLSRIIRKMWVTHEVEPYISNTVSLSVSGVLIAVVYSALNGAIFVEGFSKNALQTSIAVILIGLFIMITRRKAVTQVIGLLFMENGLFLAGFSFTSGMPTVIELGVMFDVLMGVIILGIFAVQIRRTFSSSDLDRLNTLKG